MIAMLLPTANIALCEGETFCTILLRDNKRCKNNKSIYY